MAEGQNPLADGRATFTIPGRGEFMFRVPDVEDLVLLDKEFPLLPSDEALEEQAEQDLHGTLTQITKNPDAALRFVRRARHLLVMTALRPKLTEDFGADQNGDVPVRSIPTQDRLHIFLTLVGLAGFNREAAAELAPLSEAGRSLLRSIASPNGTGSSPVQSSTPMDEAAGTDSKS